MNLIALKEKLIAAARAHPPGERVPYAFEKRIMARLLALPKADEWVWWARALWRGAAACAGVALLLSSLAFLPLLTRSNANLTRPADLEETVMASVSEADPTW